MTNSRKSGAARNTPAVHTTESFGHLVLATAVFSVLALSQSACSKNQTADLAKARPVMDKILQAERDHRGSHGNYWRDHQAKVSRDEAMKSLGVDIADAPNFEFTIEPPDSGYDPVLRITARGAGTATTPSLACVQDAKEVKPDCKETP